MHEQKQGRKSGPLPKRNYSVPCTDVMSFIIIYKYGLEVLSATPIVRTYLCKLARIKAWWNACFPMDGPRLLWRA